MTSNTTKVPDTRPILVLACTIAAMWFHQSFRWSWFIDDAAICFAYARNFVQGYGLVPFPGGERVEAISDPLWVFLLSIFQAVGLDGFKVAKPLALLMSAGTGWISWKLAQRILPEHTARGGHGALIAPMFLAASAQFAIWSASGLENALFCFLLSAALLSTVTEIDAINANVQEPAAPPPAPAGTPAWRALAGTVVRALHPYRPGAVPYSAVFYVLLSWTRPEGLMYAFVGGAVYVWGTLSAPRAGYSRVWWLVTLAVPVALSEALRVWYFAWPLPNTFYAKITNKGVQPLEWHARGWFQLREWSGRLWHAYFSPLYLLGLIGRSSRQRLLLGFGTLGAIGLSLLWPGVDWVRELPFWPALPDPPRAFVLARILAIVAAGGLLPLLALGTPGGLTRLLCGWTAVLGLAFSVYADGDWMGAFRFMSLVVSPMAVLFAGGLVEVADWIEERLSGRAEWVQAGWVTAAFGVGLLVPPNLWQTRDHILFNINETTTSVKLRADYTRSILRRTFWEEPVTHIEVDQGAHLWWNPDYAEIDMAMLVDVPMARHWYQQRDFIREYVFKERPPTFGFVGGWWAEYTGLRKYPEWNQTMFELPGYQNIPPVNVWFKNVFARRTLVMTEKWEQPQKRQVKFDWGLVLKGWDQPAPWARGGEGYIEVPFSVLEKRSEGQDVQVVAFIAKGRTVVASWSLPMGYGFYPMSWWKVGQVFRGRHAVSVPWSVQPGTYDLGFLVTGPKGRVIPALELPPGATGENPVLGEGEVRFANAIKVLDPKEVAEHMETVRADFTRQVGALACDQAEKSWIRFKRHRPEDWAFHDEQKPVFASALAKCWAQRAFQEPSRAVNLLARSHRWDPLDDTLARVGHPVAERLIAEGRSAQAIGDWEKAYDRYADVLRFQPWRSWVRRWAEEARDHRLGLTDDVRIGWGGENDLRAWEEANGKAAAKGAEPAKANGNEPGRK